MKLLLIFATVALFSSITEAQVKRAYHKNDQLKCQVSTKEGNLDGTYTSWHPNGQKKAEGQFQNNQKKGAWKVWNSAGILKVHREYQNNFQFKTAVYQDDIGEPLSIPELSRYELTKNKDGFIDYPATVSENVYWEKMLWRKVERNKINAPLFSEHSKKSLLNQLVAAEKIPFYAADSDEFKEVLSLEERKGLLDEKELEVVAYVIKEVQFFELTRSLCESRILGICPIVKVEGKEKALCWLKYEDIRPFLAKQKASLVEKPMVETLEDWLHFRHFQSLIKKESNVYNREIADYATGDALKKEQERIEMELIDQELDFWTIQAGE